MHFASSALRDFVPIVAGVLVLPLESPGGKGAAPPSGSRRPSSGAAHLSQDTEAPGGPGRSRAAGALGRSWMPWRSRVMLVLKKAERLPKQAPSAAGRPSRICSWSDLGRHRLSETSIKNGFPPTDSGEDPLLLIFSS